MTNAGNWRNLSVAGFSGARGVRKGSTRRWLWIGGAVFGACAIALAGLYWLGLVRFAYPDPQLFPVRGIDVSHHQGAIDWHAVARQDIRFVYLKASEGGDWRDTQFQRNFENARANGLAVGAYHYFTLCAPGAKQARNFIAAIPAGEMLPPAIDVEYIGNCTARPAPQDLTRELTAFIAVVKARYGVAPVIYSSQSFYKQYLTSDALAQYPLWTSQLYGSYFARQDRAVLFWQFAKNGRIAGINGHVDMNVFNGSGACFDAFLHHTHLRCEWNRRAR